MAGTVDISELDKVDLLLRLFAKAPRTDERTAALTAELRAGRITLTESATWALKHSAHVHRFLGCPIEVDLSGDTVDPTRYDSNTRPGTLVQVVARMRHEKTFDGVDIRGLTRARLLVRLWVHAHNPSMNRFEAEHLHFSDAHYHLEHDSYVDMFLGHPIKVDLDGFRVDHRAYDLMYGEGTFARAVLELREEQ